MFEIKDEAEFKAWRAYFDLALHDIITDDYAEEGETTESRADRMIDLADSIATAAVGRIKVRGGVNALKK